MIHFQRKISQNSDLDNSGESSSMASEDQVITFKKYNDI